GHRRTAFTNLHRLPAAAEARQLLARPSTGQVAGRWWQRQALIVSGGPRRPTECPLLAQSRHPDALNQCPLLGVKRTLVGGATMSAFDPKRTPAMAAGVVDRLWTLEELVEQTS